MKRDWDLVRTILVRIEELEPNTDLDANNVDGYDDQVVASHTQMMEERGLIKGIDTSNLGSLAFLASSLTWEGHELLDEIRNDTAWNSVKSGAKSKGVDLTIEVIKGLAKAYAKSKLGLDL